MSSKARKPFLFLKALVFILILQNCTFNPTNNTYYVGKDGSDSNKGLKNSPFLTINKAARVAQPGDKIIIREGTYREWVKPSFGGNSEEFRIIYQAADGEDVRILGSEVVKGWKNQKTNIWKIEIEDSFFGDFNPFKTLTRHPEYVGIDESGDGWGWLKYGRWTHLGDIFINGEGLTEKQTLEEIFTNEYSWYIEPDSNLTILWANFGIGNPNLGNVEINKRPYAFFPEKAGLNYITLKGITIMNVACHWAPPTVYQPGAVGSNGGHHWIIEDNIILYAKALGISIGIPTENFNAKEAGNHIIRNNVIMRCGQGAIAGQRWNSESQLYNNHIEEINYRKEFGGWETAGIKQHNAKNLLIKGNFIRGVYTIGPKIGAAHGIWNDFKNSNWKVTENVIMNTDAHAILVEANWAGPNLYLNNIILNSSIGTYSSRGDAWLYNLFINSKHKWENQEWGDRVQIGNSRWMQNIFIGGGLDSNIIEDNSIYSQNIYLDSASYNPAELNAFINWHPSQIKLNDTNNELVISFHLNDGITKQQFTSITLDKIDLPFQGETVVLTDFYGNIRDKHNFPGPFVKIESGMNEFVIYKYSPQYKKAKSLINGN